MAQATLTPKRISAFAQIYAKIIIFTNCENQTVDIACLPLCLRISICRPGREPGGGER